jgi:ketosteroid isomerase-like protein
MSEERVEVARRILDALNRGDRDIWLELCDPEIEWNPPAEWPESGGIRGREAVWEFVATLNEPWEQGDYEIAEIVDPGGDKLAARLHRTMRGKASGLVAEFDYWTVLTFRADKLSRCQWFSDRADAESASGAPTG